MSFAIFFSFTGHKNIGVRYLLFLIPIAAVWSGRLAISPAWYSPRYGRALAAAVTVALIGLVGIAVASWPYYLTYFNFASGGPDRGHEFLLDSNVDWGQDLITLRDYMQREGIESVDLAYFGRVDPAIYGINYRPLVTGVDGRYAVISTNLLFGRMYFLGGYELHLATASPITNIYFRALLKAQSHPRPTQSVCLRPGRASEERFEGEGETHHSPPPQTRRARVPCVS